MEKLQRIVYQLLFIGLSFGLLYFGKEFLIPVTLSAVFAMLFIRLSNWLEQFGMSRGIASLLCILLFLIAITVIIFLLSWQLSSISENMDSMKSRLLHIISDIRSWIDQTFGISPSEQQKIIKQDNQGASGAAGSMAMNFAGGAISMMISTVLVIVYTYLFLYYRSHIKSFIIKLIPRNNRELADDVVHKSSHVAQKYLSGLGAMIALLWVMYGIGFTIVGVQNAIFFAVLCGLLEIVPFVGNLTGTSITVLSVIVQGGDTRTILFVLLVYGVVQFIQTYILEPLVVGEQVNINPLFTIMSIVLGEMVWGIAGMILAIPLLGIVKIICDNSPALQPYGFLIGTNKVKKARKPMLSFLKK